MDARLGKPIEVTVPEPGAAARQTVISYASQLPNDVAGGGLVADAPDGLYTAQLGPQRPATGFTSLISGEWVRVNADGSTDNSPYAYHLAWYEPGRMPNGLTRRLSRRDLATVHAHYAQAIPGSRGMSASFNELPGVPWGIRWADVNLHVDLPFTRDEYYNTDNGVQWESFMTEDVPGNELSISGQTGPYIAYQRGRTYDQDWNKGVFGPVFPERPDPVRWVTRTGDDLLYWFPWYGDSAGRVGGSEWEHSRLTLYRDDVKLCETLDFEVGECNAPAADGRFRLELAVDQGAPVALSTRTTTTWTFRSRHVDGDTPLALPVSALRFTPALDTHNSAPSGKPYQVPVTVQSSPDRPRARSTSSASRSPTTTAPRGRRRR